MPLSWDGDRAVAHVAIAGDEPTLILTCALPASRQLRVNSTTCSVRRRGPGLKAAMGVDRQRAAQKAMRPSMTNAALAFLAEAQKLELVDHREGEAVVDLGDVDVMGPTPAAV
jgi:hypothetical protein